jgi:hypothetical protein
MDEAEKAAVAPPKPVTPPAVKPAAPAKDKVATASKPTAMLRPSMDRPISVAAIAD